MRSVQSPKYLNGTPPSCPASRFTMASPVCPAATRRIHASAPVEFAELRRDGARRFLPELMAADAVDVAHALAPGLARDVFWDFGRAAEIFLRRHLHHRVPVDRRVIRSEEHTSELQSRGHL